jgi:hypothetical protein
MRRSCACCSAKGFFRRPNLIISRGASLPIRSRGEAAAAAAATFSPVKGRKQFEAASVLRRRRICMKLYTSTGVVG